MTYSVVIQPGLALLIDDELYYAACLDRSHLGVCGYTLIRGQMSDELFLPIEKAVVVIIFVGGI
jgi:hypothetical protein